MEQIEKVQAHSMLPFLCSNHNHFSTMYSLHVVLMSPPLLALSVRLSRPLVGFWTHFKSPHFHSFHSFIHFIHSFKGILSLRCPVTPGVLNTAGYFLRGKFCHVRNLILVGNWRVTVVNPTIWYQRATVKLYFRQILMCCVTLWQCDKQARVCGLHCVKRYRHIILKSNSELTIQNKNKLFWCYRKSNG